MKEVTTKGVVEKYRNQSAADIVDELADKAIQTLSGDGTDTKRRRVMDNLVAFIGASGGVGTSTIVANVAVAAKKRGLNVLVVDTNIQYPSMHYFFGIKQEMERKDLASFVLGKNNIGDSLVEANGISILCANNRTLVDSVNCDSPKCSENLFRVIEQVRELFDLILLDCSNRLDLDIVNTALYKADSIYIVWDESLACVSNTDRIRRNMDLTGIESNHKMRLVLNKRTSIHYSKYPISQLNLSLVSTLPFDLSVIECGLRGGVFMNGGDSTSKNAIAFASGIVRLTDKILEVGGYGG